MKRKYYLFIAFTIIVLTGLYIISFVIDFTRNGNANWSLTEINYCNSDDDCGIVCNTQDCCCTCISTAINKKFVNEWRDNLNAYCKNKYGIELACPAIACSYTSVARCVENKCVSESQKYP